jgi:hypothetical protein
MDRRGLESSGSRFEAYVEGLASVIGHKDRERPLRDYCVGLMLSCERKSVEPIAAVTAPARVGAQHQSLLHFVGEGRWSDERVLAKVREIWFCQRSSVTARSRHGSSTIPDCQRRVGIRSGSHGNMRSAWQGRQLPGGGVVVDCQRTCKPAGGVAHTNPCEGR